MKTNFQELKDTLLKRAKDLNACEKVYSQACEAENEKALLFLIKDNWYWCNNKKIFTSQELMDWFSQEVLESNSIYVTGNHTVSKGLFYFGGNATVAAWGNATVEVWGNATVEARDNVKVKASGNVTVKAFNNVTVEAWGNAFLLFYNEKEKHKQEGHSVLMDFYSNKIYLKSGEHEVIYTE